MGANFVRKSQKQLTNAGRGFGDWPEDRPVEL